MVHVMYCRFFVYRVYPTGHSFMYLTDAQSLRNISVRRITWQTRRLGIPYVIDLKHKAVSDSEHCAERFTSQQDPGFSQLVGYVSDRRW